MVKPRVASKVIKVSNPQKVTQNEQSTSKFDKFSQLRNDPDFKQFLNEMVDVKLAAAKHNTDDSDDDHQAYSDSRKSKSRSNSKSAKQPKGRIEIHTQGGSPAFKSPSDMTIYSPGLRKIMQDEENNIAIIDKISNFVEWIRIDNDRNSAQIRSSSHVNGQQSTGCSSTTPKSATVTLEIPNITRDTWRVERGNGNASSFRHFTDLQDGTPHVAQVIQDDGPDKVADQLLVQAEKFKAQVEAPKGKDNFFDLMMPYDYDKLRSKFVKPQGLAPLDNEILFLRNFDQDDEFFHVTSQIEPNLRQKIERGEFVDLERLLPGDRTLGRPGSGDDLNRQLFQLISQGTGNYLEPPVPKTGKINSVQKWEQAFRVFAAIYTNANPGRASEIWQYVYVIHTAAAANPWDNVYFYDINFCELMTSKPWRSWGKTYTQGWNMAFNNNNSSSMFGASSGNNYNNSKPQGRIIFKRLET